MSAICGAQQSDQRQQQTQHMAHSDIQVYAKTNKHYKVEIDCSELLSLHDVTSMHRCMLDEIGASRAESSIFFALTVPAVTHSHGLRLHLDLLVCATLTPWQNGKQLHSHGHALVKRLYNEMFAISASGLSACWSCFDFFDFAAQWFLKLKQLLLLYMKQFTLCRTSF